MRLLTLLILLMLLGCSSMIADTGNGSETTNGYVALILDENNLPVIHASVYLRRSNYYRDTAFTTLDIPADYSTDSNGLLVIDSLPEESMILDIRYGKKAARIHRLEKSYLSAKRDTLQLRPVSTLFGTIDRNSVDPTTKIFVQIEGLERIAEADSAGLFSFASLPEGAHSLRIISSRKEYGIVENDTIVTVAREQRNGGTFRLPFEYWRDSVTIRSILDINGLTSLGVDSVVEKNSEGRITGLNLTKRGISIIPETISSLRLRRLLLDDNQIDSLSPAIGKIFTLESLSLKRNLLVYIPGSIGDVTHLRHLDLSSNLLSSLPESIINLTELEFLVVANNALSKATAPISTWLDTYSTDQEVGGWRATQK